MALLLKHSVHFEISDKSCLMRQIVWSHSGLAALIVTSRNEAFSEPDKFIYQNIDRVSPPLLFSCWVGGCVMLLFRRAGEVSCCSFSLLLFSLGHSICSAEYISPLSTQSLTAPVCVIKLRSSFSTALHTTARADILLQVKTWIFPQVSLSILRTHLQCLRSNSVSLFQ